MSQIENLLRAATSQTAAEVLPESIPPLDAAALHAPPRLAWRLGGPLSPLYAAVAVVLVAAVSVTLATVLPARRPPAGPSLAAVPPYYVAMTATGNPADGHPVILTVRATFTGRVLATVAPPRPYGTFALVDGTADDRTFLVAAQMWRSPRNISELGQPIPAPMRLFWLRYDPASGRTALTALRVPQFDGEWVRTASVSPDGTRLAVLYEDQRTTSIRVYILPGGAEHTWSITAGQQASLASIDAAQDDPTAITWGADDRTISFVWSEGTWQGVYVLDTAAAGSNLMSASRLALPWSGPEYAGTTFVCDSNPFRSADGKSILCAGGGGPAGTVTLGFGEFSAVTGKLITILDAQPLLATPGIYGSLMWASRDARILIGLINGHVVVVSDGRAKAIPWSPAITSPPDSVVPGAAW